jgi:dipeptidyl-peptidase-4
VRWIDLGAAPLDIIHTLAWSPSAPVLLVDKSDVFVKDRRVMVVQAASGASRTLVREAEPMNVSAEWWAAWSPDGSRVLFTSDRDTDYHVYDVPLQGGAVRALTRGDWAVFGVDITPRGLLVVANRERSEERQLFRVPLTGGEPVRVSVRSGTHAPVVSPDGRRAAVLFSSDTVPPDLYVTDLTVASATVASERRITTSPRAAFASFPRTAARYVTFPSRTDGVTLHGRLLLPRGWVPGTRLPVIVGSVYSNTVRNQWGGRNAHPLWGLDAVLLDRGYAVFAVDVAGSSGHGTNFRRRIRLEYGGVDVEDLHSGVEYLIREGIADATRIGLWGSSYGGLLTTMSLFTKPGVYAAGIAGAPATNVWHALTGEQRVMMRPQEQMAEYAKASSHTKAAGLRDHLLIIHGMRDVVVLYKDSVWLTQYLMQMGRDVELLTLPDAQHGWDAEGLYQTRFAFRRMLEYFDRHLGPSVPR